MNYIGVGLYVSHSAEAVALYERVFGLELGYNVRNEDGSFFHSELCKDGQPVVSVVEATEAPSGENPVQLGFEFSTADELRKAFDTLREGGNVRMEVCELPWSPCAAEIVDRFGIRWYLTVPQHRQPDSFTPSDMA